MLLQRVVGLCVLAIAVTAQAQTAGVLATPAATPSGSAKSPAAGEMQDLIARRPVPKFATADLVVPDDATGTLIVKFDDDVRARVAAGGAMVESAAGVNIPGVAAIMNQFGLTARPAFNWAEDRLARLEQRAAAHSGKAQPDLAGVIFFEGPPENLLAAAKAFNDKDFVEFVTFKRQWRPLPGPSEKCCFTQTGACLDLDPQTCINQGGVPQGPGTFCGDGLGSCTPGACCTGPDNLSCVDGLTQQICEGQGGVYQGDGTLCADIDCEEADNDCGAVPDLCFEVHPTAFCTDGVGEPDDCCNTVCAIDPSCCDEDNPFVPIWDDVCVAIAYLYCEEGNVCASALNGSCFESHSTPGCIGGGAYVPPDPMDPPAGGGDSCCEAVCAVDPFCCDFFFGFWDGGCVETAIQLCQPPSGPGNTQQFMALQGYTRAEPYTAQAGGSPAGLAFPAPLFVGYTGEGWNLGGTNYNLWVINEVLADPDAAFPAGDANNDGLAVPIQDEFIEIVNNHHIDLPLANWTLSNGVGVVHTFPAGTVVSAQGAIVVFGGGTPTGGFGGAVVQTASTGALLLPDIGDTITLSDPAGRPITSYTYGPEAMIDASVTRFPDVIGSEPLGDHTAVSPTGAPFSPGRHVDTDAFAPSFEGLYGLSRELFEVFGIGETTGSGPATFQNLKNNGRGKGVRVAVIEWACYKNHEDLLGLNTEPGQTLIPIPENSPDHATACLGIIGARENGYGVTGIAPEADLWFFPLVSIQEGPREEAAFLNAYETLEAGDVVSCSFGPGINLNNDLFSWLLLRFGSDMGITTCVAAANECDDLSSAPNLDDSGAIVVGAGQPGFPHCRLTFSNYHTSSDPADSNTVHCQAWGENVVTLGYGNLSNPNGNPNRKYTNSFNGTSAATPQIAGLVGCLQGLAKQFYGIPVSPVAVRNAISIIDWNFPQCGFIDPDDLFGFPSDVDCGPDTDPDAGPNKIGAYPTPARGSNTSAAFILNQSSVGFGDSPLVDSIQVLKGQLLQGNAFSIKGSDDNYLIIASQLTNPSGPGVESRGDLGTGHVTDLLIQAHTTNSFINDVALSVESFVTGGTGIMLLYMWDYDFGQWLVVGANVVTPLPDDDLAFVFPIVNAQRFVGPGNVVLIRAWTISLGLDGAYQTWHDWINFEQSGGTPFIPGG